MSRKDARTPGSKIQKRRPTLSSEDRLHGLCTQVNVTCTKWLASRNIDTETHCWSKRINYQLDEDE
jgi:hypothetical protein